MVDARDVLANLGVGLAAVSADLEVAVVGPDPEHARQHGRFLELGDGAELVVHVTVVFRQDAGDAPRGAAADRARVGLLEDVALRQVDALADRLLRNRPGLAEIA